MSDEARLQRLECRNQILASEFFAIAAFLSSAEPYDAPEFVQVNEFYRRRT